MNRGGFNDWGWPYARATITGGNQSKVLQIHYTHGSAGVQAGGSTRQKLSMARLPAAGSARDAVIVGRTPLASGDRRRAGAGHALQHGDEGFLPGRRAPRPFPGAQLGQGATRLVICASPSEAGRAAAASRHASSRQRTWTRKRKVTSPQGLACPATNIAAPAPCSVHPAFNHEGYIGQGRSSVDECHKSGFPGTLSVTAPRPGSPSEPYAAPANNARAQSGTHRTFLPTRKCM